MRKEKSLLMVEDKQLICNLLCQTLQATRGGCDLKLLAYENDENRGYESVTAYFFDSGGGEPIDVTGDSGVAMIGDIMKHLRF